jgi:ABC-type dipeptide/oligopeptide/nickel transport system permease subunit
MIDNKMNIINFWNYLFLKIKRDHIAVICTLIILSYFIIIILASLGLIAQDYNVTNNLNAYSQPSLQHWFGTDFLGRSVLSRAIQGARTAVLVGFFAASISTLIGLNLGLIAGYFGGWIDDIIIWLYTTLDSIPYILLLSAFAFSLGQGIFNLYIALGLTSWVQLCRLIRSEVIKQREKEYLFAALSIGASHRIIIFKHILPNVLHLALIQFSLTFVSAIKLEVILSYMGMGVEPGTPSWGIMINDAQTELSSGIWWSLSAATLLMFILILSINLLTDSLRSALDPRLNQR